jgi:hypothetical protein
MTVEPHEYDRHALKIREWLLVLLRFAVTRQQSDHAIALTIADELDAVGGQWRPAAPRFFTRTTDEICAAIATLVDGQDGIVLRRHIQHIEEPRLQRAFQAAVGLVETREPDRRRETRPPARNKDLWRGLPVNITRRA